MHAEVSIEELPPQREEILRCGNEQQVPCRDRTDSSLAPPEEEGLRRAARSKGGSELDACMQRCYDTYTSGW